ncbi:MAG TPA: DUF4292 domain-containing protein [Paludibacter sp.]
MRHKIIIPVLILLIFSACKTTKTIAKKETKTGNQIAQTIEQVQKKQPQFRTANVSKMSLELDMNDRKLNVSGSCKIRKDSAMFVSFQVFGFEVFKAELLTDSMRVFDKMNRRYFVTDYSYFSKRFGVDVDYYSLQSLLAAQFFCVGSREIQPDSCKLVTSPTGQNCINFETGNMLQSTQLTALNVIQQVILKAKNSNYQLQTTYADYADVNGISFPQKIALLASNDKTKASCDFSILKVEFNTDVKFVATGTDRYTRGNIDQILKK